MLWSIITAACLGAVAGIEISRYFYDKRYQRELAQWQREKEIVEKYRNIR